MFSKNRCYNRPYNRPILRRFVRRFRFDMYIPVSHTNGRSIKNEISEVRNRPVGIVQSIYENYWHNLKQIATEFFSAGMHSGEVSLKHTKNPLRHLWGKQVKSAIKVTFSH